MAGLVEPMMTWWNHRTLMEVCLGGGGAGGLRRCGRWPRARRGWDEPPSAGQRVAVVTDFQLRGGSVSESEGGTFLES